MDEDSFLDKSDSKKSSYDIKLQHVSVISKPMASRKLTKKLYKLIKKAYKHKKYMRNGLKDVQKFVRKGETGLAVLAGDVSPIDIMCHMPAVLEEKDIPYDIGAAMGVKRSSVMVLIKSHEDYQDLYDECKNELKNLPHPLCDA
ncbi:H/ACA ribonucleoprotein complex subunit 2-like protein [Nymphon striatum]|nr:H/ACA ribonucleoprotein complex subunit 2-like protein [Nymphon striatum]